VWLLGLFLPLLIKGKFPSDEIVTVIIFALTVIGDAITIPYAYVFKSTMIAVISY
jgi:hypothetical protein